MSDSRRVVEIESTDPEHEFNPAVEDLTRGLNEINPDGTQFHSEGEHIGWRNVRGGTNVQLTDGEDLLKKLTPTTDWRLVAGIGKDYIEVTLFHHDSPTGETHFITPRTEETQEC